MRSFMRPLKREEKAPWPQSRTCILLGFTLPFFLAGEGGGLLLRRCTITVLYSFQAPAGIFATFTIADAVVPVLDYPTSPI